MEEEDEKGVEVDKERVPGNFTPYWDQGWSMQTKNGRVTATYEQKLQYSFWQFFK